MLDRLQYVILLLLVLVAAVAWLMAAVGMAGLVH